MHQTEFFIKPLDETKQQMTFYFAESASIFEPYTENGWLYLFSTQKTTNEGRSFIKFGLTSTRLIKRLKQYKTPTVSNIYAIQVPCVELSYREGAMKQIFKICKTRDDIDIWEDYNIEFIKGNFDLILRVYLYFCTCTAEEAYKYKSKQHTINPNDLKDWLIGLPLKESYDITVLYNMTESVEVTDTTDIETTVSTDISESSNEINESEKHICNKCGKECKDKRGLGIHNAKCEGITSCECKSCKQPFANPYSLSVHLTRCKVLKKQKEDIEQKDNETNQLKIKQIEEENKCLRDQLNELQENFNIKLDEQLKHRDEKIKYLEQEYNKMCLRYNTIEIKNKNVEKELRETIVENRVIKRINNQFVFRYKNEKR